MTHLKLFSYIIALILVTSANAWAQATFGAEFTFTNSEILSAQTQSHIVNNEQSERYRDLFAQRVLSTCDGCTVVEEANKYGVTTHKVTYPDGFYFVIATDPAVVEVQTKPSTVDEIKVQMPRLERDLFGGAKAVGMNPQNVGGGHIHMGLRSSVGSDLLAMRNLIVDFANHPEIALGILADDQYNSTPVASLPKEKQEALRQIIADVDAKKIRSIRTLSQRINDEVYNWHRADWTPTEKYHALNLVRAAERGWDDSERTVEFRSIRPEKNEKEFLMLTRLLEGRLTHVKKLRTPIELNIPSFGIWNTNGKKIENFSKFVTESGIDFHEFISTFALSPTMYEAARGLHSVPRPTLFCERVLLAQ